MRRHAQALFLLVGMAACQGGEVSSPNDSGTGPSFAISDRGHGGNPDFSFRPPMVPNTTGGSAFNPNLSPSVIICPRNAANTACSGLSVVYPNVKVTGQQYHLNWKVPNSSQVIYRITVVVGTTELGFADVWTAAKAKDLNGVNTHEFVPQVDGSTLPIKFTIGQYAFCETPGVGPCGTETFSLTQGGDVVFTPEGSTEPTGVIIPPQPTGGAVTLTAEPCESFNPRVTDLPTFGKCVTITTDPELPPEGLAVAATVFVCDLSGLDGNVNSHEQGHRISLHRLDIDEAGTRLEALPHAVGCPPVVASVGGGGLKGFFANLLRGRLGAAGRQLLAVFQPATLYARRLNEGAGGSTDEFSDFQFMLPGKLEKVEGDGQSGPPGSTLPVNPKVRVTDLGGEPIRNARVRWAETAAACRDLPAGSGAPTDVDGHASTSWTLSGTPGANSLAACGRGIAGDDFNGPRDDVVDPFQAFPYLGLPTPESGTPSGPVELKTGSVVFTADGVTPEYRVAGVGANSGNLAADQVFSSGDLEGSITRINEATFNAMTPAQLRADYDVLIITWASDPSLNVDWDTRLKPYLELGGGVIFEDPYNIDDLASVVTTLSTAPGGESAAGIVMESVAGLTDGISPVFDNNHIRFATFPSWMYSYMNYDAGGDIVGLYGQFGTGCIVLSGPDQDYHAHRTTNANQYNLLLNQIRFVRNLAQCAAAPDPGPASLRAAPPVHSSPRAVTPQVRTPRKVFRRPVH